MTHATLPATLHTLAGAPTDIWTTWHVTANTGRVALEIQLRILNKAPTRLPEALFFQFKPTVDSQARPTGPTASAPGWRLRMFNNSNPVIELDPLDVLLSDGTAAGGAPHTRCIAGASHVGTRGGGESHGALRMSSLDVPCISTGVASPFPTPLDRAPVMDSGVSYNIYNNIWNTNYILFYPFDVPEAKGSPGGVGANADKDLKLRFSFSVEEASATA